MITKKLSMLILVVFFLNYKKWSIRRGGMTGDFFSNVINEERHKNVSERLDKYYLSIKSFFFSLNSIFLELKN